MICGSHFYSALMQISGTVGFIGGFIKFFLVRHRAGRFEGLPSHKSNNFTGMVRRGAAGRTQKVFQFVVPGTSTPMYQVVCHTRL